VYDIGCVLQKASRQATAETVQKCQHLATYPHGKHCNNKLAWLRLDGQMAPDGYSQSQMAIVGYFGCVRDSWENISNMNVKPSPKHSHKSRTETHPITITLSCRSPFPITISCRSPFLVLVVLYIYIYIYICIYIYILVQALVWDHSRASLAVARGSASAILSSSARHCCLPALVGA
jgi:hypothetical protein